MTASSLLPPGSTPLERALEQVGAQRLDIPTPLRTLWSARGCPVELLPWLAWALSIDGWDATWPERVKRARIGQAIEIQRHKGTAKSVTDVVAAFGGSISIREWWQQDPPGEPYTFDLILALTGDGDEPVSAAFVDQVVAEVNRTKPLRSTFTFSQALSSKSQLGLVAGARAAVYARLSMQAA